MSKTAVEYLGDIRLAIGTDSDDTSLFPTEQVLWALNAGLRQITTEREWPWLFKIATSTTTLDDDTIDLPADHSRTSYITVDGYDLDEASPRELAGLRADDDGASCPALYAVEANTLRIYPKPTAGLAIEHAYFANEATLVGTQQTITLGGAGLTSFTLTYSGQTTASIDDAATAADIQAALVALSNIAAGEVVVAGSVAGPFTVTFKGSLAGTTTLMTATPTGGTGTVTVALVASQQPLIPDAYSDWVTAAGAVKLAVRTNNKERLNINQEQYDYWLKVVQDNVRRSGSTSRQRRTRLSVWPEF